MLQTVKEHTTKETNSYFLINDHLHEPILDALIDLYEQKIQEPDGKTNLLAHDIVEQVFIAFDKLKLPTKHHVEGSIIKSPFAVFEFVCKQVFEDYIKNEKHDYSDLKGWNQAVRDEISIRKGK